MSSSEKCRGCSSELQDERWALDECDRMTCTVVFPPFGHTWKNEHVYGEIEAFDIGAIEGWFKRCLEDTPSAYLSIPWNTWFKKWFSQFIEKDDKDD